jgi:hypothetical protein
MGSAMQTLSPPPIPFDDYAFIGDLAGSFASASIHGESCDRCDAVAGAAQRLEGFSQSATQGADYPGSYDGDTGRPTFFV